MKDRYVILPTVAQWSFTPPPGKPGEEGFSYRSNTNPDWLSQEDLRKLVEEVPPSRN